MRALGAVVAWLFAVAGCVEPVTPRGSDAARADWNDDAQPLPRDVTADAAVEASRDAYAFDAVDARADVADAPGVVGDVPEVAADAGRRCPPGDWLLPDAPVDGIVGPSTSTAPLGCTSELASVTYYRLVVPPRSTLTLSLAARVWGAEHLRVHLLDDCGGRCLAEGAASLTWRHEGPGDRVVVAAVYGAGRPAFDVPFSLRSSIGPPDPLAGCEIATPVQLPARVTVSYPPVVPPTRATCGVSGRLAWYRVVVPAGRVLVAGNAPIDGGLLVAAESCGAVRCAATDANALRVPASSMERELFVGVRAGAAPATVALDLGPEDRPGDATPCAAAPLLPLPSNLEGPIFASGEVPTGAGCVSGSLRARFYRVEIPPRSSLTVESLNDVAAVTPVDSCADGFCGVGRVERSLDRTNLSANPASMTFALLRTSLGVLAPASVRIRAVPLPPERVCDTAPSMPASGEVTLAGIQGHRPIATSLACGASGFISPTHYFRLDVPPRSGVRVEATGDWRVTLVPRCDARECLGATTDDPTRTARWANEGDETARVIVAATETLREARGTLRAQITPYDGSMRCETGRFLTDVPQETSTRFGVDLRVCWSTLERPRPAAWWRVRVPVGRQARIVLDGPRSSFAPSLNISARCGAFACVPGSVLAPAEHAEVVAINEGPGDTLYVQLVADEAPRRISATIEDPPTNRRCDDATPLAHGVERIAERLPVTLPGLRCGVSVSSLPAALYTVEVPPRARLRVSVRAGLPVALRLYDGCAAATCEPATEFSATPSLTWTNASDGTVTRLVAVASRDVLRDRARETFAIVAAIEPAPDGG